MSANSLMLIGNTPLRIVDAADFDGLNDVLTRSSLTGTVDSKTGLLSFWYRIDGGNGTTRELIYNNYFVVDQQTDNRFYILAVNAASSQVMGMHTPTTYASGTTWRHILAAWDMATATMQLYISDVSDFASDVNTNDTINYDNANVWAIGATNSGVANPLNGCLAELYFAPGQYLNLSDVVNRRKFISGLGKPVHLGTDGSLPTGTAPIIYLHLDNAEAVANFATNRGTGGNFTITGTLDTATTSPSD